MSRHHPLLPPERIITTVITTVIIIGNEGDGDEKQTMITVSRQGSIQPDTMRTMVYPSLTVKEVNNILGNF